MRMKVKRDSSRQLYRYAGVMYTEPGGADCSSRVQGSRRSALTGPALDSAAFGNEPGSVLLACWARVLRCAATLRGCACSRAASLRWHCDGVAATCVRVSAVLLSSYQRPWQAHSFCTAIALRGGCASVCAKANNPRAIPVPVPFFTPRVARLFAGYLASRAAASVALGPMLPGARSVQHGCTRSVPIRARICAAA